MMVKAVTSFYKKAIIKIKIGSSYSFVGVHQESMLSPFLVATVIDVVTEEVG